MRRPVALLALLGLLGAGAASLPSYPASAAATWRPHAGVSWQWQLDGPIQTSVRAHVYDVDSSVRRSVVSTLHGQGPHP
jgi:hypothetical protein